MKGMLVSNLDIDKKNSLYFEYEVGKKIQIRMCL